LRAAWLAVWRPMENSRHVPGPACHLSAMPKLLAILALALAYNLSWLLVRRHGFSGVVALIGWLAAAAIGGVALAHGPIGALAAGLAAAVIWMLRDHWLHYFERPGIHCRELGGRLHLAGVGYGAFLMLDLRASRARQVVWIEEIACDATIGRLLAARRLLKGAGRIRFGELRRQSGRVFARVYADGRDITALLSEGAVAGTTGRRRPD
jgi:hypothetical protein